MHANSFEFFRDVKCMVYRIANLILQKFRCLVSQDNNLRKIDISEFRLVILHDNITEIAKLNSNSWPCIRYHDPVTYEPLSSDWVYCPSNEHNRLTDKQLHSILYCLTTIPYDFIIVTYGYNKPPFIYLSEINDSIILSSDQYTELVKTGKLPCSCRGRLIRFPPLQGGALLISTTLSGLGLGNIRNEGQELVLGNVCQIPSTKYSQPLFYSSNDPRPLIVVMPAIFAVGGVERNTVEIMRALGDTFRFVLVTNEVHNVSKGSLHHQLIGLVEDVFDLAELAPSSLHLELLVRIIHDYNASLIWICNGSTWLSKNAVDLRNTFADMPIVDQQAYDTDQGWIAHFHNSGIQGFDRFIAVNSRIRDVFNKRYGIPLERIDLIYPAIDSQRFSLTQDFTADALFRDAQRIPQDVLVFALVGRLHEQKRPLDFLELARRSQEAGLSDVFVLIGNGDLGPKCHDFVIRHELLNIRFIDYCEDMAQVFSSLTGLIITSAYEGLPIVSLEAMASGVPILSTDVGDISIVFKDHGVGRLYGPVGDVDALWHGFLQWRKHLDTITSAARDAAPSIGCRFSSTEVARHYTACWSKALAAYGRHILE
jgi:glycosyltransferase involved in cell wall biosynthesis